MDDQELRELLEKLHGEVEHTRSVDSKGQELLHHLSSDIGDLLKRSEIGHVQSHPTLITSVEDSIDHFQVTHPALSVLLTRLLETLSNAGI
jgi:hypothetical protein